MRPSATIVIPAWNEWALTRSCLETLRPTLGIRDQVVVVDNGSVDGTAAGLRRYPWVTVVSHPENTGFGAGCNSGAAVATGEVVVFLNNDTLLPSRWLDGLLAPFVDASVAATGPRSNFVSGPQLVEQVPYESARTSDLQRFARAWRAEHRGQTTPVDRLVGFCLAVRRDRFEQVGGFDVTFGIGGAEDDDLCLRLVDAGHRLLIAHESFVHHHGHRTFEGNGVDWYGLQERNLARLAAKRGGRHRGGVPDAGLLSACLIVKDEAQNLPSCLAALSGLVDEVVVYDTGSTDSTTDIARAAGARVIEGFWDDDFARARNAALDSCTGTWILHVDADEVVEADVREVRDELRRAGQADAMTVAIGNVDADGRIGVWHNATRLFRRGRARWAGRLHEQLVAVHGGALTGCASTLRLRHTGYTDAAVAAKDKMRRNLRVAQLGLRDAGGQDPSALINLGRSLTGVGRFAEAVDHFSRALEVTDEPGLRRQALRFGVEALLNLGRPAEALEWLPGLRSVCSQPTMPDYFEGLARLNLRDPSGALECFSRIDDVDVLSDEDMAIPGHFLATRKGLALIMDGRYREAADALLSAVDGHMTSHALWSPLLEAYTQGDLPLAELVSVDPDPRCLNLLGHAANASPDAAQRLALHLWESTSHRPAVVALLKRLARTADLGTVLEWSLLVRQHGFAEHCPLRALAASDRQAPLDRLRAVAVLTASLGDSESAVLLSQVAAAVPDPDIRTGLLVLDQLAPALLPSYLLALVADRRRVALTAQALDEVGAHEQAESLREHCVA